MNGSAVAPVHNSRISIIGGRRLCQVAFAKKTKKKKQEEVNLLHPHLVP